MIVEYIPSKLSAFKSSLDKEEFTRIESRRYMFREKINLKTIIDIVYRKLDERMYNGNYSNPEYIILGVDIYESLIAGTFNRTREVNYNTFMGMKIILDGVNRTEIKIVDCAKDEFFKMLEDER